MGLADSSLLVGVSKSPILCVVVYLWWIAWGVCKEGCEGEKQSPVTGSGTVLWGR